MKKIQNVIQLSAPSVGNDELLNIQSVFETGYLGMGDYVKKFEDELSTYFNREVVCVSSGTSALHLALVSIGIKEGDEVLVSGLTYIATFQAIIASGGIPVACDINSEDLTIDLNDAKSKITSWTKAIIPVHYAGYPGNLNEIYNFAKNNNLRVIEDAAHAFGTTWGNKLIGSQGDIVCFSFDPIKNITCGDGGAIVTNDIDVIEKSRAMRFLGIKDNDGQIKEYDVISPGWRYHMNNISAAIGLAQLKKFSKLKEKRQLLAKRYYSLLSGNRNIELLPHNYNEVVPHLFVIKLKRKTNEQVIQELSRVNIQASYHYYPPHMHSFIKSVHLDKLNNLEMLYNRILSLPLHPELSDKYVDYICHQVNKLA